MRGFVLSSLVCAAALGVACRTAGPPRTAEEDAALCLPPDTVAAAGLHLDAWRAAGMLSVLPASWGAALEPLHEASYALIAYTGREFLVVARGRFSSAPSGAELITPELAVAGSPEATAAARRQHAGGKSGAPSLVEESRPIAAKPMWLVVPGRGTLPLTGNLANLNRLIRFTDYTTVSAELQPEITLRVTGLCSTAAAATQLEETLRAMQTFGEATTRDRDLSAFLHSIQLQRQDTTVQVTVSATRQALEKILR